MDNSFEVVNRLRCFNHTLHLSAWTLLKPFNAGFSSGSNEDLPVDGDNGNLSDKEARCEENDHESDDGEGKDNGEEDFGDVDDDCIDELEALDESAHAQLLEETAGLRETISKVFFNMASRLHR